nr:hypothetical protein [uncultured Rhodoferax sp.]
MSAEHTKGQLTTAESAITANEYTIKADANWLFKILHNGEQTIQTQRENMRRMVACWNACNGITTEEVEWIHSTGGMISPRDDIARIATERNALLSAAKAWLDDETDDGSFAETLRQILARSTP